jgi:hypothetical protein
LQDGAGRHRIEAEGLGLPFWPLARLAQDEEPGLRCGEAGRGLATEADVTRPALGTVEWFKRERLHLIEFAKAIDGFGAARRSFQKLIELGPDGDPDLRAALHTSGVISYARPFVSNTRADGTRGAFPKKAGQEAHKLH